MGALGGLRRWWERLIGGAPEAPDAPGGTTSTTGPMTSGPGSAGGAGRVSGQPPSGNGASSFHLIWDLRDELSQDLVEVAATLEVRQAPSVNRLYFWALQASFTGHGRKGGAAHLGLQFHPEYPGRTAANWGGYDDRDGRELHGSVSSLPSAKKNVNTRDFDWRAGRRYRLRVAAAPAADQPGDGRTAWRGTVTDLHDGRVTVVRDLWARGDRLCEPMVWSEVFARCEEPSAEVRWSELEGVTADGRTVRPAGARVNYQTDALGGCANTNCWLEGTELVQRTATSRSTPTGTRLTLLPPADDG